MIATGVGFVLVHGFWPLLIVAFVGTLNPSAGDVSVFYPLEQSLLARSVAARDRTALFARYSLAGSLMGAVGTLLAALPDFAEAWFGIIPLHAMQAMFLAYAATGLIATLIYRRISEPEGGAAREHHQPLGPSRGI